MRCLTFKPSMGQDQGAAIGGKGIFQSIKAILVTFRDRLLFGGREAVIHGNV